MYGGHSYMRRVLAIFIAAAVLLVQLQDAEAAVDISSIKGVVLLE